MTKFGHRAITMAYHLITAIMIVGAMTFMAHTESRWFPVVSNVEITNSYIVDDILHISGSFEKERGQCVIVDASFWKEKDGKYFPLELVGKKDVLLRPEGKHVFGEWHIKDYTQDSNLIISVIHSCHILWYTDSIFYKGKPI